MHPDRDPVEHLELRLPVAPASVPIGRRAAAQFAEEVGCSPETLWAVRLSVSEAVSNVVLHAHPDDDAPPADLVLDAAVDDERLTITVTDVGTGLRARPDSPGLGLGLALIASSCEELAVDTGAAGGTVVRMTFHR